MYKDTYTPEEAATITINSYAAWLRREFIYDSEVKTEDGLVYFTDTSANPKTNEVFFNYCFVYKNKNDFWVIQFATPIDKAEIYGAKILKWAKTVKFNN